MNFNRTKHVEKVQTRINFHRTTTKYADGTTHDLQEGKAEGERSPLTDAVSCDT